MRAQSSRILLNGLRNGDVTAPDKTYLVLLVAARTELSQADAAKRVDEVIAQAKACLLYTSPSPRDGLLSRMPSSA